MSISSRRSNFSTPHVPHTKENGQCTLLSARLVEVQHFPSVLCRPCSRNHILSLYATRLICQPLVHAQTACLLSPRPSFSLPLVSRASPISSCPVLPLLSAALSAPQPLAEPSPSVPPVSLHTTLVCPSRETHDADARGQPSCGNAVPRPHTRLQAASIGASGGDEMIATCMISAIRTLTPSPQIRSTLRAQQLHSPEPGGSSSTVTRSTSMPPRQRQRASSLLRALRLVVSFDGCYPNGTWGGGARVVYRLV